MSLPINMQDRAQDRAQLAGDVEHRQVAGQKSCCRVTSGGLHALWSIGQSGADLCRQVGAQRARFLR